MNNPKFMGQMGRSPEEAASDAKWANMAQAMRETDSAEAPPPDSRSEASPPKATGHGPVGFPEQSFYTDGDAAMSDRNSTRPMMSTIVVMTIVIWLSFAGWLLLQEMTPITGSALLLVAAALATPPLLLVAIGTILWRPHADPAKHWHDYARGVTAEAERALEHLASAEERLNQAYAALERQSRAIGTLTEGSADAVLTAARTLEAQAGQTDIALRASGAAAADALSLVRAIEERAPEVDERLLSINRTLTASGAALASQSEAMEEQLNRSAIVAEEARMQLGQTHDAVILQMAMLRDRTRETGEELTATAELASARVELVLERARTAMATARDGLADHMAALAALGDQGEHSAVHVRSLGGAVEEIGQRLASLEQEASGSQTRIAGHLAGLGAQAERVGAALQQSNVGAGHLIERVEALLLALDSNIREIDESLPAALGRFDTRLLATEARLGEAATLAEGMAGTADAAARHLEQASATLVEQSRVVEASIRAGDASLTRHTGDISALRTALDESAAVMERMVETGTPQLLAATERLREEAIAAAARAEEAITIVVARAAQALAEASGDALDKAVSEKVNAQIAQIAEIADNAVKSAHRATDHLMREMMAIADTATDLEQRMASARQAEETRERDHIAERSAQIIATLNDSAIDVARWFEQDIGQREWSSYLSGDKSLFARRAVKLVGNADIKQVHARYDADDQFREHVSRYVEDFEAMLAGVLEARHGHTLAIALLSSDLGKLYVALAQAIERLRVA